MSTALADSFLRDLDAPSSSENESSDEAINKPAGETPGELSGDAPEDVHCKGKSDLVECVEFNETTRKNLEGQLESAEGGSCSLLADPKFLEDIDKLKTSQGAIDEAEFGAVGRLQDVNDLLMRVDNEILQLFQMCRELYGQRFPELEALIPTPLDYLFVMRKLGNDLSSVNDVKLNEQLGNSTVLAVSVAASVSVGHTLSETALERVMKAAGDVDKLVELRTVLVEFIEKAMVVAAPNLTAIIGFSLAARLVAHSGGLKNLATMPSQNLLVVGGSSYARRTAAITAAGNDPTMLPQMARNAGKGYGVIYECDLVQGTQPSYRAKAMRLVGGKAALAVRRDVYKNDGTNTVGKLYRQLIVEKLKKIQAPLPARLKKPLPIPEEQQRARRGGRRKRRWKEKYGMTELRKKANRLPVTIETAGEPESLQQQQDDDDDDDVF